MFRLRKPKISEYLVDMDAHSFTVKNTLLKTHGVSTCIAIAMRGCFREGDDLIRFCGLWHWSGFQHAAQQPTGEDILNTFFYHAQDALDFEDDAILHLDELSFIGGEKEQRDENGDILLSGTEREVQALRNAVSNLQNLDFSIEIAPSNIHWHNFYTQDEMSISVEVQLNSIVYKIIIEEALILKP
ncbi:hypothetical protein [Legionella jordanis]|nr:hypothetical protein [Legionella jordanis]HAT8712678.1 hypothetical protein [Legionella jordanis]